MKIRSCKAKGRSLVKQIREALLEAFPQIDDGDIKIPTTSCPGEDLWLSSKARTYFPFSVEAKNVERLNVYSAYKQAARNASMHTPIVVFTKNHAETFVMIRLKDFIYSLKEHE